MASTLITTSEATQPYQKYPDARPVSHWAGVLFGRRLATEQDLRSQSRCWQTRTISNDLAALPAAEMRGGDATSRERLYEAVYVELRAIAAHKMASERPDHTLQPTALANDAYLRLSVSAGTGWKNRAHFFAAAAEAVRRVLIDRARQKLSLKRGRAASG